MACLSIQQIQVTCNLQNLQTRIHFSMKYLLFFQIFERIFPHHVLWLYGSSLRDKHGFPWLTTWWSLIFLLQNLLVWCSRLILFGFLAIRNCATGFQPKETFEEDSTERLYSKNVCHGFCFHAQTNKTNMIRWPWIRHYAGASLTCGIIDNNVHFISVMIKEMYSDKRLCRVYWITPNWYFEIKKYLYWWNLI